MKPFTHDKTPEKLAYKTALLALLAGIIVFTLLADPSIINPLRVGWLAEGDTSQSYMGWLFFRQEPWTWPLGTAHMLGMEQASSIVYTDSIPLLAIGFKLLHAWLPLNFQYDGLWLASCYALQGYFACRLLSLFTSYRPALVMGTLLFLLSPIMLLRAPSHLALTAHWIIVAALYFYYAPPERRRQLHWLLLLWLAPLVHAYLMFMIYGVWAAYLLRHGLLDRRWPMVRLAVLTIASAGGSLAMMWLAGYFHEMDVSTLGYGYYSMNLLAPFMPLGAGPFMLHSPAAATTGQYEGFNYLGAGVLLALALTAVRKLAAPLHIAGATSFRWRQNADVPIVLCCIALTLLAMSNVVTFGSHVLFTLKLPTRVELALNVFRASGRMFWVVYYMLVLTAVRGALGLPRPLCLRLLMLVLVFQLIDVSPFIFSIHSNFVDKAARVHFPDFSSPFWKQARSRYANIYVIPGTYQESERIPTQYLAGIHGFAIDTAYYARLPAAALQLPRQRRHEQFFEGVLDPNGLYLVQPEVSDKLKSVQHLFPPTTGVGVVDGFTVVAPLWFENNEKTYLHRPGIFDFPTVQLDHIYRFGKGGDGAPYMLSGWSVPGDGATWSEGSSAVLAFHVSPGKSDVHISLSAEPYLPAAYPQLVVDVSISGHPLAHWFYQLGSKPGPETTLVIPESLMPPDGNIALSFHFNQARSPVQARESADSRMLALLLHGMTVTQH